VEEWDEWREAVRVNMRKPLGMDCAKRRYWSLGGQAACWRVYVEEEEGALWGWYEGRLLDTLPVLTSPSLAWAICVSKPHWLATVFLFLEALQNGGTVPLGDSRLGRRFKVNT